MHNDDGHDDDTAHGDAAGGGGAERPHAPEGGGDLYRDRWIRCAPDALHIRGYYFPWGSKTVPYDAIRGVRRVEMGLLTGQGRIWGSASPTVWAHLDPGRPGKSEGLLLDIGKRVRPFITPDDTGAAEAALRSRMG